MSHDPSEIIICWCDVFCGNPYTLFSTWFFDEQKFEEQHFFLSEKYYRPQNVWMILKVLLHRTIDVSSRCQYFVVLCFWSNQHLSVNCCDTQNSHSESWSVLIIIIKMSWTVNTEMLNFFHSLQSSTRSHLPIVCLVIK